MRRDRFGRTGMLLSVIVLLALFLRLIAFIEFRDDMNIRYDARNYWIMSHQMVEDGVYGYYYYDDTGNTVGGRPGEPNARVMPGYPVFLALVYRILGDKYRQVTAVRLLQVVISSISCILAFHFVRKVFKKDGVALLTALFMAVYPTYIFMCINLLTETLAMFTFLLYLCLLVNAIGTRKTGLNILTGMAFGSHILVRPALLPLFILPFVFFLIAYRMDKGPSHGETGLKTAGRLFALQLAGFVTIMLPWWIRNIVTLGALKITADASGNPLLGGTYPYFVDYFRDVPPDIRGDNARQLEWGIKRMIEGFRTDPWLYLEWFTIGKTKYLFETPYLLKMHGSTQKLHLLIHRIILASGVPGIILHSAGNLRALWFYLYGLAILAIQLMFIPDPRFAFIMIFFLMTAASHFAVAVHEFVAGKESAGAKLSLEKYSTGLKQQKG